MADQTILYRFRNEEGELLYVGITDRGPRRWREHQAEKPWFDDVASVDLERFPTREKAIAAENKAIRKENPKHNISNPRRTRTPKTPEEQKHDFRRAARSVDWSAVADRRMRSLYMDANRQILEEGGQLTEHGDDCQPINGICACPQYRGLDEVREMADKRREARTERSRAQKERLREGTRKI